MTSGGFGSWQRDHKLQFWGIICGLIVAAVTGIIVPVALSGGSGEPSASVSVHDNRGGQVANGHGVINNNYGPSSALSSAGSASKPPSVAQPLPAADECGPDASRRVPPRVQICVDYWCRGDVFNLADEEVRSQAQIKIRPRLINNSDISLSIDVARRSALRLLVTGGGLPQTWKPPRDTKAAGDQPARVMYGGRSYWALPPNVPHDARLTDDGQNYTGFATSWSVTNLRAGSSYFEPLRFHSDGSPIQRGDLVFQVPAKSLLVGLALTTRHAVPQVLGVSLRSTWPASSNPSSF